jgi:hypothetical protein
MGMANPRSNPRSAPRPARVPPERAQGLDPEFTAQPRPLSDQFSTEAGSESGLSVDPDDLGSRFLAEATEQMGAEPLRTALENELTIVGPAVGDGPIESANNDPDNTLWEQTVNLTMQTLGSSEQLRSPPFISDGDPDDDDLEGDPERDPSVRVQAPGQQGSLLDDPTGDDDETRSPATDTEEAGHHAQSSVRGALGAQVDPELSRSGVHFVQRDGSSERDVARSVSPAAVGGRSEPDRSEPAAPRASGPFLRRALLRSAAALRVAARRLSRRG